MADAGDLEVTPEPPDAVAEAIAAALRTVPAEPAESPWWRAGIEESLRDELD